MGRSLRSVFALLLTLAAASCRKGIEGEGICREVPLLFQNNLVAIGDGMGTVLARLGQPIDRLVSPFGRETWIYPHIQVQATYSNAQAPGWYFFNSPQEDKIHLIIHFDEAGKLTGLSSQPADPETFQIKNAVRFLTFHS